MLFCGHFQLLINKFQNKLLFLKAQDDGCYSNVGRQGGRQVLNLKMFEAGKGCFSRGSIIHEILHSEQHYSIYRYFSSYIVFDCISALGFHHMQSSPDRDEYVKINWQNIKQNKTHNFRKYSSSSVTNFNFSYDYRSIMHYHQYAFSINDDGPTIEPIVSLKKFS